MHLLLAHPGVRPRPRTAMAIVVLAYVDGLVPALARADAATLVLAVSVLLCALARHRTARGRERRSRRAALWAAVGVTGVLGAAAAASLLGADPGDPLLLAYDAAVAGAGFARPRTYSRAAPRSARWRASWPTSARWRLPGRWGAGWPPRSATLSSVVAYRLPDHDSYVDEAGRSVSLPSPASGRTVTAVEDAGQRVAVIVHDDLLVGRRGAPQRGRGDGPPDDGKRPYAG